MTKYKYADNVELVSFPESDKPNRVTFYHDHCLPAGMWRVKHDRSSGVFLGPNDEPVRFTCEKCGGQIDIEDVEEHAND